MADTERTESSQLNPVAAHQGFRHFLQDCIDNLFRIVEMQKGPAARNQFDKLGFDHVLVKGPEFEV